MLITMVTIYEDHMTTDIPAPLGNPNFVPIMCAQVILFKSLLDLPEHRMMVYMIAIVMT